MDWDDLKVLLAVADSGSIDAAARSLEMESAAVKRSLTALESILNCDVMKRTASGWGLTPSGERAVAAARTIAAQVAQLKTDVGGEHGELTGTLCVTSTAGFVPRAMKAFEPLRAKYPALDIDVMVSSHVVDLKRKEADLAVRMFKDSQPGLALHKLGTIGWSLYASEKYLAGRTAGENPVDGHTFIAYDSTFSNTSGGRWLAANVTDGAIGLRVGGIRQALDAAAGHHGVCIVPCYLTNEHKVVRVTDQVVANNDVYAVFLAEREKEPRMRIVIDTLVDLFQREQTMFAGT